MKKKKGFTLIEIIAVILVLGIIIILVLPSITGSSVSTKQKAYNTKLELIKDAAVMYGQDFYGNILKEEIHPEEEFKTTDICIDKQVASNIIKCTIKVDTLVKKDYLTGENGTQLLSNPLDTSSNLNEDYITLWIDTTTRKISTSELEETVPTAPIPEDKPLPPEIVSPSEPSPEPEPEESKVEITLSKIEVASNPTKTVYAVGENFSKRGMQIRAIYSDNSTKIVTAYTVKNGTNLTNGQNQVTISYTENGVTKTTIITVTAKAAPTLASGNTWYKSSIARSNFTTINIINSADAATITNATESWPAAADTDGDGNLNDDIMCYVNGTTLTIAGNGVNRILLSSDASYTFSASGSVQFSAVTSINGEEMLDTTNVTKADYMFYNCSSLTSIDVSDWNTSNIERTTYMFLNCKSLTSINVSKWNTSNLIYTNWMFAYCSSLTSIDVSRWNTPKLKGMGYMFNQCSSLTTIDLSSFDTTNVVNYQQMLGYCTNLKTIYLGPKFGTDSMWPSNGYFILSENKATTVYNANQYMKKYAWDDDRRTVTFKTTS